MSRRRRFKVDSLEGLTAQDRVTLPETERRHAQVLRLQPGDEVELFDGSRQPWLARMDTDPNHAVLIEPMDAGTATRGRTILATAWPKGKRSSTLVEKSAELGVDEIIPLRCTRSVVHKDSAAEGVDRLRRIAGEAAKQSGRSDVPHIAEAMTLPDLLRDRIEKTLFILLDPRAELALLDLLRNAGNDVDWCFLIGPEGGFTADEIKAARDQGAHIAKLGRNVLRVETAAMAVCALAANVRP